MPIEFHDSPTQAFHVEQTEQLIPWIEAIIESHQKSVGDINIILQTDDELLGLNQTALKLVFSFYYSFNN